ncbi:MAG: glycerol-3-phosphate dehydrogenase/oxidase [Bdellovibrio sp.]|nr:glycerol-3-phosphate dehydrogenase/oxidase [Bdellovibrio sp.]
MNSDQTENVFEVVVVGGGITGAGILRDLTSRKVKSLLIEKGDFASGTSSKSGKLIHGGLRYLRYGHVKTVWESCQERVRLYKILAPHLTRPVNFHLPFYRHSKTPFFLAAIGLFVYDLLSSFRNIGRFKRVTPANLFAQAPKLSKQDYVGALSYWDCFCLDTRLTIENLKSAQQEGARCLNYVEFKKLEHRPEDYLITCWDHHNHGQITFRTKKIIFACGAWSDNVLMQTPWKERFGLALTSGIHLLISRDKLTIEQTLALEHPVDRRNLYLIPWENRVLVGTTDNFFSGDKDHLFPSRREVDYLLDTLRFYFPSETWSDKDILSSYIGIRPLIGSDTGAKEESISRDYVIKTNDQGLYAICGGKLTTFRRMAKKLVDQIYPNVKGNTCTALFGARTPSASLKTDMETQYINIDPLIIERLIRRYGDGARDALSTCFTTAEDCQDIATSSYYVGEIKYLIRHEWAKHLSDIVVRRTDLYFLNGNLSRQILESILKILATELQWSAEKIEEERKLYERYSEFFKS